jgi:hypothetical protein
VKDRPAIEKTKEAVKPSYLLITAQGINSTWAWMVLRSLLGSFWLICQRGVILVIDRRMVLLQTKC